MNAKERIYIEREREDRRRMMQIQSMKKMLGQMVERINWNLDGLEERGDKE